MSLRGIFSFFAQVIVGYGAPIIFAIFLWFALQKNLLPFLLPQQHHLFSIVIVSLFYMWTQGVAAAWVEIGSDGAVMLDILFSVVPLVVIIIHIYDGFTVREGAGIMWQYVTVIGMILAYDLIINTKILFKIARLTSELVKAKS